MRNITQNVIFGLAPAVLVAASTIGCAAEAIDDGTGTGGDVLDTDSTSSATTKNTTDYALTMTCGKYAIYRVDLTAWPKAQTTAINMVLHYDGKLKDIHFNKNEVSGKEKLTGAINWLQRGDNNKGRVSITCLNGGCAQTSVAPNACVKLLP